MLVTSIFIFSNNFSSPNFKVIWATFDLFPLIAFNFELCKRVLCGEVLTLSSINTHFDASTMRSFENILGKEEIARNEQFLLFPQCFLLNQIIVSPFVHIIDIICIFATELEEPKIGI